MEDLGREMLLASRPCVCIGGRCFCMCLSPVERGQQSGKACAVMVQKKTGVGLTKTVNGGEGMTVNEMARVSQVSFYQTREVPFEGED